MVDDDRDTPTTNSPTGADEPAPRRRRARAAVREPGPASAPRDETPEAPAPAPAAEAEPEPKPKRRRTTKKAAAEPAAEAAGSEAAGGDASAGPAVPPVLFQPPAPTAARKRAAKAAAAKPAAETAEAGAPTKTKTETKTETKAEAEADAEPGAVEGETEAERTARRRRRRGGRGRGKGGQAAQAAQAATGEVTDAADAADASAEASETEPAETRGQTGQDNGERAEGGVRKRRRRRRRTGEGGDTESEPIVDDDGVETVVRVRPPRKAAEADEGVRGVKGSTRLEAKRQRRRDGRESGRRRPPIITESEFLARREAVERVMVVRQAADRTQIAVLEDGVLVEHYVTRADASSMVGNIYLGKVQNVLPSMEAAFVDIGRGRNAVLYAGEVNYDASALEGRAPRIEQALKSGQSVLVQVTKDPIGHKGSRLTNQASLPGRYMVYVPDGRVTGISRKLPDTERNRLKGILKRITPENAGVIIRTAAEGASEEDLARDLTRLKAQWDDIEKKAASATAPSLIYAEPDLVIRVVRDVFNEDFKELVVQGDEEWETVDNYVRYVAPDLADRTRKWTEDGDIFAAYRVDEQLAKGLERKVWLPSGGYLIIDRTEAMIVIDVNTGKFTGKGGNLEETVTKNNLEAAEEIVRQLRLRDLGGIIVIDFIDMVLESNRELVLRRLMECLGRDRTKHQVAEVTSLGLVQMTRKRVGNSLLDAFSETCKECGGRGVIVTIDPFSPPSTKKERRPGGKPKPAPPRSKPAAEAAEVAEAEADVEADVEPTDAEPDTEVAGALTEEPVDEADEGAEVKPARRRRPRKAIASGPAEVADSA